MKYIELKNREEQLKISKIAFGCDKISTRVTEQELFSLLDRYADAGGNCLDTARAYCEGESEQEIGRWLKKHGRNHVVLSTKGCFPPKGNMTQSRLSKSEMRKDIEASLKALQTETIDLYWLHRDDPTIPAQQIITDLNQFVAEGKIRMVGCSNWRAKRIEQANAFAEQEGLMKFAASQIQWSLAETSEDIYMDTGIVIMNSNEYEWYLKNDMPVFAYASQAQGFFSKIALGGAAALSEKGKARFLSQDNLKRFENIKRLSAEKKVSVSAAALAYILYNRLPAVATIGSKTQEQLRQSLESVKLDLTPEQAEALRKI